LELGSKKRASKSDPLPTPAALLLDTIPLERMASLAPVCAKEECVRGRCSTRGGDVHDRYMSPEAAYYDPPTWASLADLHIFRPPAAPATQSMDLLPENFEKTDVERRSRLNSISTTADTQDPQRLAAMSSCASSNELCSPGNAARKWSDMSEDLDCDHCETWDALPAASRTEKVDADGVAIPRRWMRGKRGGAKHRSKAAKQVANGESEDAEREAEEL
jgi:hypothetical protein